ncbi:hypothetical protein JG688_00009832 [Phytophthora aleatoria]|uniref:tRNA ligase phosphodiesterase domain-containing protein n=1 Tax=Phytophthora aleatoria TaxID=2496075 RepID=A0A8J5MFV3_9STRA|nr:hypothetical protein JG688_00009832 [Phytophthora aleatoria]
MAWRKNRRASSASSSSRSASSAGRGGRRTPGEPAEQDIARSIQQSAVRVRVALQLGDVQDEMEPLRGLLVAFERQFEARRGVGVTRHYHVRVDLLECGLNSWQNLVELQRVLAGLTRPMEDRKEQQLMVKTMLRHDPKYDEWTLSLGFARASEDALWRFASSLMLRLKSCGVPSKVLLSTHPVVVRLASAFVEWGNSEIDNYRWEGKHVWTQLVVEVPGEERDEIQRVFLPPVGEVATDTLAQLRYPELVPVVYDMLSSKTDVGKPVVVILRGIPGSGKSTLGREIEAICRYRGVALTACSADLFFETPRGYVFDVRNNMLPSTCRLSSLVNLVSEHLVLHYVDSLDDVRPTVDDVTSGRIVIVLYNMLTYLSKLDPAEWVAAFGESLLALQGNEKARTTWRKAMETVMQSCVAVMASYGCVSDDSKTATQLNPKDHLRVVVALMKADISGAVPCCDKLRSAAAMVLPQDDDEHNGDMPEIFSCAPSLVARRVDVTASSIDLLRKVLEKLHAYEATAGHDSEGALSGDYVIRQVETDEDVLIDLKRSS